MEGEMRIGFVADVRNPPPFERPWPLLYARTLELIEEADRLGAAAIFLGEHHDTADGYLPQPLTFAAAIAGRTANIRIGTQVLVAPLRHPKHIAEEVAIVDILSDGRVELGLGSGYVPKEFTAFGVDRDDRFKLLDRTIAEVQRLLVEGVSPRPVQDPVPIWVGYFSPMGARRAGRLGVGMFSMLSWCLEPYLEGLTEGGHDPASARMAGIADIIVSSDPERTRALIAPHIRYQADAYGVLRDEVEIHEGREPSEAARVGAASVDAYSVLTPEDAVQRIRQQTDGLPVEYVTPWLSVGGMPDDLVEEHINLTVTRVAPALADG
jgi:alkanesulfonate monooxygenase SsuD/methylene tetrahydromethanopterin reductase-like flavin-dependent oxidoreductase (luciferase family)